jgi:pimeloyl-ACP methyl ester carboxylesterase
VKTSGTSGRAERNRIGVLEILGALGVLFVFASLTATGSHASVAAVWCEDQSIQTPVPSPKGARVDGTLCYRGALRHKTLVLMLPGIVANRSYFDFPVKPRRYSLSRKMAAAGFATFTIDRIGTGSSDRPPFPLVDLASNTRAAHAVVTALRAGQIGGVSFKRIAAVGHSFGALIASRLATDHTGDLDAVALTGATHEFNTAVLDRAATGFYPAQLDPKFGPLTPPGYLTNTPGARERVLFQPGNHDPSVAGADEGLKDTVTIPELLDLGEGLDDSTLDIDLPVFLAVGQRDQVFCGEAVDCSSSETLERAEGPFFSPEACLRTFVLPEAGHYESLHLNAGEFHQALLDWADDVIGARSRRPMPGCAASPNRRGDGRGPS